MISPQAFYHVLTSLGVNCVVGVPDSLLKPFCAYIEAVLPAERHLIAANEGTAVAIASGVHLATGGLPLVYLQNSGLGNTLNPLLSLADPQVYGIPLLLLVGWRGEPGVKDEPQHSKQGAVTPALLTALDIPHAILDGDPSAAEHHAHAMAAQARQRSGPAVLLARQGVFAASEARRPPRATDPEALSREHAIELITATLPETAIVVATTGHISRELYEQRRRLQQDPSGDFLTVGSMGHASQIALGIALMRPDRRVVCLDGDGAALMHLGGLATLGTRDLPYLVHIVLNNGVHDSVGGQPTVGFEIQFTAIARACGYRQVYGPVRSEADIRQTLTQTLTARGPVLVEIRVNPGARADLGRPQETPAENKVQFMQRLRAQSV